MFQIMVDYPTFDEELQIVRQTTQQQSIRPEKLLEATDILFFQELVRKVPVPDNVLEYAVQLVQQTRPDSAGQHPVANSYFTWGAGPRASQYLILAAKCHALLHGKFAPDIEDVRAMTLAVLQHRVIRNYKAEAAGLQIADLIHQIDQSISHASSGKL